MASNTLFLFLLSTLLLLHSVTATLEENCKRITGPLLTYEACMATFQGNPASKTADLPGLGVISTNLVLAKAKTIQSRIADLLKNAATLRPLQDCNEMYGDLLADGSNVIKGFQSADYVEANTYLSAFLDTPDNCENGFKELKAVSPLTDDNNNFHNLVEVPLRISYVLNGH